MTSDGCSGVPSYSRIGFVSLLFVCCSRSSYSSAESVDKRCSIIESFYKTASSSCSSTDLVRVKPTIGNYANSSFDLGVMTDSLLSQ